VRISTTKEFPLNYEAYLYVDDVCLDNPIKAIEEHLSEGEVEQLKKGRNESE
jgi:hypothetical protein